jgi:hypothetical protein
MTQKDGIFRCGDGEALMTYAYGESSPPEHEAITTHVARCATCAEELVALAGTRQRLTAWTPPVHALGFQIPRSGIAAVDEPASPASTARVLRPAAWWNRPLPAWAQMAAAVVIFASGLMLGGAWSSASPASPVAATNTPAPRPAAVTTAAEGISRQDLAQIEQRLRNEIAEMRTAAAAEPAAVDTRAVMQRVSQMIAASEARQQKELDFRTSVLATDLANGRRIDNANFEQRLRGTNNRVLSNQQTINSVVNSLAQPVGYTPGYSQFVP